MKQILFFLFLFYMLQTAKAQTDSTLAVYIKSQVEKIEERLDADILLTADTTITDDQGTMTVATKYYIFPGTNEVEKIMEKSLFGTTTTEIMVYYRGGAPIMFATKQYQGSQLKVDFDYYFQTDNPVYVVKREFGRGNPDSDEILKWCYQLLRDSKNKNLVKADNEETRPQKPTTDPKKKTATTKKPLLPFFKKKKN